MSNLELQALQYTQYIPGMPEDKLRILIETFQKLVPADELQVSRQDAVSKSRRLGSLKGQRLISDGYDIDESNAEIAGMFGVDAG